MVQTIDREVINSDTFVFAVDISPWAEIYPLEECSFRAHLRPSLESHIVLREWSTENERIEYAPAFAGGLIAFEVNPSPDSTITIGQTVVTFKGSSPTGNQVLIGGNVAATLASLQTFLSGSADVDLSKCTYVVNGTRLNISAKVAGSASNALALATTVSRAIASGTTLEGGGHLLTMLLPIDMERLLNGPYVYSVRLEYGEAIVTMFEGKMTFKLAPTR